VNPAVIEALERVGKVCGFGAACGLFAGFRLGAVGRIIINSALEDNALTSRRTGYWNNRYFDRYYCAIDMLLEDILTKEAILVITARRVKDSGRESVYNMLLLT
jgi:hypothetical protein